MGFTRRRRRDFRRKICLPFATFTALAFLLFGSATSAFALTSTQQLNKNLNNEGENARQRLKGLEHGSVWGRFESTHSRLSGPGSSPPRCISKCGRCRPCKPVHVSIHPGLSMPLEYYPEAWRCQCRNKLFMP